MGKSEYYVYMLRCADYSIYTGITTDLNRRMTEHFSQNEKCAKDTLRHKAKKLECVWKTQDRVLASKLEFHIKRLNKKQKEELIEKNNLEEQLFSKIDSFKYTKIDICDIIPILGDTL